MKTEPRPRAGFFRADTREGQRVPDDSNCQRQLDMRAIEVANQALGKAESLERQIERDIEDRRTRHAETQHSLGRIGDSISKLHGRIDEQAQARHRLVVGLGASLIAILLGLLGYLLTSGAPWISAAGAALPSL